MVRAGKWALRQAMGVTLIAAVITHAVAVMVIVVMPQWPGQVCVQAWYKWSIAGRAVPTLLYSYRLAALAGRLPHCGRSRPHIGKCATGPGWLFLLVPPSLRERAWLGKCPRWRNL